MKSVDVVCNVFRVCLFVGTFMQLSFQLNNRRGFVLRMGTNWLLKAAFKYKKIIILRRRLKNILLKKKVYTHTKFFK